MIDLTRTTTVLLEGLFDEQNRGAWEEFDARYRPILVAVTRRLGLDDADASDVVQETLARFVEEYRAGRYDRDRGKLRSWLLALARSRVALLRRKRAQRREMRGASALVDLDEPEGIERVWEEERRSALLREALEELRTTSRASDRTMRAFDAVVVRRMPVAAAAAELGMSEQEIYLAKSRLARRLREIVERLEGVFDEGAE